VPDQPEHPPDVEHYFSAAPASPAERRRIRVRLAGEDVEVETAAGIFSPTRLDLGSEVLLRTVPAPPPTGELLDLGCGWGPVALTLARRSPASRVWAVDVNERALGLVRANASRLGLTGVVAARPQEVPADVRFDVIWSNPPIRVGKAVLHDLLAAWLPRLRPGGRAFLVVQRHLGADSLQAWLAQQWPGTLDVARAASAKGYRVLEVAALSGA
jgi:16S rRNA (guanine1207-N2)-methyltransferase